MKNLVVGSKTLSFMKIGGDNTYKNGPKMAMCIRKTAKAFVLVIIQGIPSEITDKYYGCGTPLPF